MPTTLQVVDATKKWIEKVVIACNFCPFAAKVVKQQTVHYQVEASVVAATCLAALETEFLRLDGDDTIETLFLIFPNGFARFADYLLLVQQAERLLKKKGYTGVYQLASFHPLYLFAGSTETDAANYTNRSVYPMLHLLRESSIDAALAHYPNPSAIPPRNIDFAQEKGVVYMRMLRESCSM
jgi:uncharacterized protein